MIGVNSLGKEECPGSRSDPGHDTDMDFQDDN